MVGERSTSQEGRRGGWTTRPAHRRAPPPVRWAPVARRRFSSEVSSAALPAGRNGRLADVGTDVLVLRPRIACRDHDHVVVGQQTVRFVERVELAEQEARLLGEHSLGSAMTPRIASERSRNPAHSTVTSSANPSRRPNHAGRTGSGVRTKRTAPGIPLGCTACLRTWSWAALFLVTPRVVFVSNCQVKRALISASGIDPSPGGWFT